MRLAVVDLGSNSFHLAVVDVDGMGTFVPVTRHKEMLGLGAVVARRGHIPPPEAHRAAQTFRRLLTLAQVAGADTVVACATAAIRQAANGPELVAAMETESGVGIRILSGEDEGRLMFTAVLASVQVDDGPVVCLDVGGGSLEVVVGGHRGPAYLASAELGAARLSAELVHHDPPGDCEMAAVRQRIADSLDPIVAACKHLRPAMAVGTGGVVRDLARLVASRRGGSGSINQLRISIDELRRVEIELGSMRTAERAGLPGIERARARVAPVGAAMLAAAMERFEVDELTIARWGLREGVILEYIGGRRDLANLPSPDPRAASVDHLLQRFQAGKDRGRHLAELATRLFDATHPLHGLGPGDRELLRYGGLLADVGRHVSARSSHKHSAYLVEHGNLRGFDPEDVAVLATLARFHRGGQPTISHPSLAVLDGDRQDQVMLLAALLRLAHHVQQSAPGDHSVEVRLVPERAVVEVFTPGREAGHHLSEAPDGAPDGFFEKVFGWSVKLVSDQPSLVA